MDRDLAVSDTSPVLGEETWWYNLNQELVSMLRRSVIFRSKYTLPKFFRKHRTEISDDIDSKFRLHFIVAHKTQKKNSTILSNSPKFLADVS